MSNIVAFFLQKILLSYIMIESGITAKQIFKTRITV